MTQSVFAQGATRDLSGYAEPGVSFTVTIAIDPPAGTAVVGAEDAPPTGWSVSNISDGGTWDAEQEKVKWPLFLDPSIPEVVTYDVTPPDEIPGMYCFAGTVSFDGSEDPIAGDECIPIRIPTVSEWGMVTMILLVAVAGTLVLIRHRATRASIS